MCYNKWTKNPFEYRTFISWMQSSVSNWGGNSLMPTFNIKKTTINKSGAKGNSLFKNIPLNESTAGVSNNRIIKAFFPIQQNHFACPTFASQYCTD